MPRNRFFAAALAFALMAAACGGGRDSAPADPVEDARPDTVASEAEQQEDAGREAPATSEAEQRQDAPSGTSAPTEAEPQVAAVANPEAEPVQVRLGDRFEWCSDVQVVWDAFDGARAGLVAAEARHQDAGDAAEEDLRLAQDAYDAAGADAASDLIEAHRFYIGGADGDDETLVAAFARAWEALIDVSPQAREAAAIFENTDVDDERVEAHLQHIEGVFKRIREWREFYELPTELQVIVPPLSALDFSEWAIDDAERAGASAADVAALREQRQDARDEYDSGYEVRHRVGIKAGAARMLGVIPTAAAAAEAVDAAESAARATTGPIDDNTRAAYAAHQDASAAADAEDAEAALAAAIRAVEHVLVVIDATSALLEAALAAEQARLNAYAAEQSPQSVIDTARDAFATSITEVLSDADAYAAFREPIQESCQ